MHQTRLARHLVMTAILLLTACSGMTVAAQSCVHCGVVAVSHPLAAAAGARVLARGGNALDAAAAVQFALNVVEPQSSGIGGGGFMMVHLGKTGETFVVDSRERAPAAASANMFMQDGTAMSFDTASASGLSVGVPGTLLGVNAALRRWGTLRLADTLAPAIALAAKGFRINRFLAADIANDGERTRRQPETAAIFHPGGVPLTEGELLIQPDLAKTLKLIATKGTDVFYRGPIAAAIVAAQQRSRTVPASFGAGRMTRADLDHYRVVIRQPVISTYRGWTVVSTPPPSSGGLTVMQMLKLLEAYPLGDVRQGFGFGSANTLHVMIESMRLAFADRAVWIGDEDFIAVPKRGLLHPAYLATRARMIHLDQRMATPAAGNPLPYESTRPQAAITLEAIPTEMEKGLHTTHFSIVDRWGNVVSYTSTIENTWGSGITVPGYGFLLNNELTDFNFVPAANRTAGNPGANDVAPHKRPRSSMAPTMLFKGNKAFAAFGSPGGSTIINSVLNTTLNLIDHHMSLQQAIDAPRLSVTDAAGTVSCEGIAHFMQPRFSIQTQDALRARGHQSLGERSSNACTASIGSVQGVAIDLKTGIQYGAADQRREGTVITVPHLSLRGARQPHHVNSAQP